MKNIQKHPAKKYIDWNGATANKGELYMNYFLEKAIELDADGIDFVPLNFSGFIPDVIESYSRKELENIKAIPRTNYLFYKIINGRKEYININSAKRRKGGKYRKKPVVIEAITFEEFIEYGKAHAENLVDGMPWSFEYKGHPVTHTNDECYIIPTLEGEYSFTPSDMLITGVKGEIYPCKKDIFEATYEPVDDE